MKRKTASILLLLLATVLSLTACSDDGQAKETAHKANDPKYSYEYVKKISITQPARALKTIDTIEKHAYMTNIDVNMLRSMVYNNAMHDYSKAAGYAMAALSDRDIDEYPGKKLKLYAMAAAQYYSCGNYIQSLKQAESGIDLAYKLNDRKLVAQLLLTVGECHSEVGNIWHAINAYDRCIEILMQQTKKTPDWDTYYDLGTAMAHKANASLDVKDYNALFDMEKMYAECQQKLNGMQEDVSGANDLANATFYSIYAIGYERSGKHAKARDFFDKLMTTRTALTPEGATFVVPYLIDTKRYSEALKKVEEEEKTWMANGRDSIDFNYSHNILMNKARILQELGQYKEAINTGMRAYYLSDSLSRRIKAQNATWMSEKMGKKILSKYVDQQERQLAVNKVANIIMGTLLFACIALIVFVIRDNRIIKNKNRVSSSLISELSKYKRELFDRMPEMKNKEDKRTAAVSAASTADGTQSEENGKGNDGAKQHDMEFERFLNIEKMIFDKKLFMRTKLSRNDVAAEANISISHFNTLFAKFSKLSFNNYINDLRMERAAKLLKEKSHYSIEAIAQECGVPVRQTFYRLFSKKYGMTPAEYRNNVSGGVNL